MVEIIKKQRRFGVTPSKLNNLLSSDGSQKSQSVQRFGQYALTIMVLVLELNKVIFQKQSV